MTASKKHHCVVISAYAKLKPYTKKLIVAMKYKKSKDGRSEMKAIDVSNHLITLASQSNENDLTNLKLQKLLYYAQGKYYAEKDTPLFSDELEAWSYGPVVKDVYHTFKGSGSYPLTVFDDGYKPVKLSKDVADYVENIWNNIGLKYSAFFLVKATHAKGTPWQEVYQENVTNIVIPKDILKAYFKSNEL
jgi:uncharacterized phage-associated protein